LPNTRKEQLEKAVINSLQGEVFNSTYVENIYGDLKDELTKKRKKHSLEKATLQRKWNVVEQQVSKLIGDIADDKLTMSSMVRRHLNVYEKN